MCTNRVLHLPTNSLLKPHIHKQHLLNDTGKNVALNKVATDHPISRNPAAYVVDGITPDYTDPHYRYRCSLAVGGSRDVWWRVDLEERFMITGVKIFNRPRSSKLKQ